VIILAFLIGLLLGISVIFIKPILKTQVLRIRHPLGEDEKYLLRAARTAGGRLIVRKELTSKGAYALVLKEFSDAPKMDYTGQVECLLARELMIPDSSGVAGRYIMTPHGWARVKSLPALVLPLRRTGAWFNSISRRPGTLPKRSS